ncbi:MAG: NADH-ubiquinone oxidoreductase chain H, partial [uncultured Chloroflexi bacterium]
ARLDRLEPGAGDRDQRHQVLRHHQPVAGGLRLPHAHRAQGNGPHAGTLWSQPRWPLRPAAAHRGRHQVGLQGGHHPFAGQPMGAHHCPYPLAGTGANHLRRHPDWA